MRRRNKKGVSQQTATVLLIGFVIALVVLIILWGKHYIEERAAKEGKLAEKQLECESVEITVTDAAKTAGVAVFNIKNLRNVDLGKFTFRFEGPDKTEIVESAEVLKGAGIKKYQIDFPEDVGDVKKVKIIPWLKVVGGYYVPCSNKHVVVLLE